MKNIISLRYTKEMTNYCYLFSFSILPSFYPLDYMKRYKPFFHVEYRFIPSVAKKQDKKQKPLLLSPTYVPQYTDMMMTTFYKKPSSPFYPLLKTK